MRNYRRCKKCYKVFHEKDINIIIQNPKDLEQCPLCGGTEGFFMRKYDLKKEKENER